MTLRARVARGLRAAVGELHWTPPGWARRVGRGFSALGEMRRARPRRFYGGAAAIAVLIAGGVALERWIASWPEPEYLQIVVISPEPTPLPREGMTAPVPSPLRIHFSGAAAPLERIAKDVVEGIRIDPPLAGTWRWESDRHLLFSPAEDWPVGERYKVELGEGFLAPQAIVASRELEFRAPPLGVSIASREFYEDPTDPRNKRVVVQLQFTHPVDRASLEQHLALRMRVLPQQQFDRSSRALEFRVSFDEIGARASIQSEPIAIPPEPGAVQVALAEGVRAARGGVAGEQALSAEIEIPGVATYFSVSEVSGTVVTRDDHSAERVVTLEFTAPVSVAGLRDKLTLYELPRDLPAVGDRPLQKDHDWSSPDEVVPEVLAQARVIQPTWIPSEPEFAKLQAFRFEAETGRTLYVEVAAGARSFGDYELVKRFGALVPVGPYPQAVEILHDGSLLALTGSKQLSVLVRNLDHVEVELSRLLPENLVHLVSQSWGRFQEPSMRGGFDAENISEVMRAVQPAPAGGPSEPRYLAVDLGAALARGGAPRGLFQVQISGWDAEHKRRRGPVDRRLVLVTDLGLLVKRAADGTQQAFAVSLASGRPVSGAEVRILGKNGLPIVARRTDAEGRAELPSTKDFEREKTPTVYVVEKDGDLAFLPVGRDDRRVDLTASDVGGVYEEESLRSLQAYLFSDRGIYRPGETVTLGAIVKTLDWTPLPAELPLEICVIDPRGTEIRSETFPLPAGGFRDWSFVTQPGSATGVYGVQLHIVQDGQRRGLLGEMSVRVEEFEPERITLTAQLSAPAAAGWISPADLRVRTRLRNLFGTPAVDHRVRGTLVLSPMLLDFPRWSGWSFFDPLRAKQSFDETLDEAATDANGEVEFALGLERFERATYRLAFVAEGFEASGGRSVASRVGAVVSPLPYLVGWRADGDLSYVRRDSARSVEVVAVDPALDPIAAAGVRAELIETTDVNVLARQPNGLLAYQSVEKETLLEARPLALDKAPLALPLPSARPGRFAFVLRNAEGVELNRISFQVVGEGNVTARADRDARLRLALERSDYAAGEEIEVSVQAPYAGTGLITIERDRVYAAHWFTATSEASLQRIRVPAELEGNGYVVVHFVRDLASPEIFMSPLASGALPFSVSRARRTQQLALDIPERAEPGKPFPIRWNVGAPARLAVLAVDEGILQAARWRTPDPLSHFLRKRALTVETLQILDLLLPEHELLRKLTTPSGDEDVLEGNLNPFARNRQAPVAFWSGVLDVPAGEGSLEYAVPEHFNGTLRVVGVAVSEQAVGVAEARSTVRGPFVIQPGAPRFAAPGDAIEITALVANTLEGSGDKTSVEVVLEPPPQLVLEGALAQTLVIPEGRDARLVWRARVQAPLGSAALRWRALGAGREARASVELSVRPLTPRRTTLATGVARSGGSIEVPVDRVLYTELREATALASASPLMLLAGLSRYLDDYPYLCSEQLVSQALPAVVLAANTDLVRDPARARQQIERVIASLQARQNADGGFAIWPGLDGAHAWVDAYATHFLMEARRRDHNVPRGMWERALAHMEEQATPSFGPLAELRARAYALYLLTRQGRVKTEAARALQASLEATGDAWRADSAALLLAAVFQQLRLEDEASRLLRGFELEREVQADYENYHDTPIQQALALYLLAEHFPERARGLSPASLMTLAEKAGVLNTHAAGLLVLGLDAWSRSVPPVDPATTRIEELTAAGDARALTLTGETVLRGPVSEQAVKLRFQGPSGRALFHQLVQSGFDREAAREKQARGLEVARELRGPAGAAVDRIGVADAIDVVIDVRSSDGRAREVAVVDLLPGGFEVDLGAEGIAERRSLTSEGNAWSPSYVDVREDRVVLYGWVGGDAQRFVYRIRPGQPGRFQVPPILIEGLYDRAAFGVGVGGEISVVD